MQMNKKLVFRLRLLFVFASILGLVFVFHKIETTTSGAVFETVRWGWLFLGFLCFGCVFLAAGARWRVALAANGTPMRFGAAGRISLIGHFFYTVLFGVAGGDTAKSALYSRWHQVPLTRTLAASSLDRLLGLAGLALFGSLVFAFGFGSGAFDKLGAVSLRYPAGWLLVALLGVIAFAAWFRRLPPASPVSRFLSTLSESGRTLLRSPGRLASGVIFGVVVQAALSGVFACCLAAVSKEPLPWLKLAWTFPVITFVSALPITFAGLGVRDGAAIALFGFYNIPPSSAVAASLLTAAVSLVWAVLGAGLLWHEAWKRESIRHLRDLWAMVPR